MTGVPKPQSSTSRARALISPMVAAALVLCLSGAPLHAQEVDVHGFISQGYLKTDRNNFLAETKRGTWEFSEIGINFSTDVTDDLHMGLQIFARDLGSLGNLNLELDWAFGDYTISDSLGIRIGRIKIPYGLYGETQDVDMVRATALLPQSVYLVSLRDILLSFNGVSLYGNLELEGAGSIDYQIFGGAIIGDPVESSNSSVALFFNNRAYQQFKIEGFVPFTVESARDRWSAGAALQYNTLIPGLLFKGTLLHHRAVFNTQFSDAFSRQLTTLRADPEGFSPTLKFTTNDTVFWVGSMEFSRNDLVFATEYGRRFGTFRSSQPEVIPHLSLNSELFYAQVTYLLQESVQGSIYYAWTGDPNDRTGDDVSNQGNVRHSSFQHDYAVSLRFDINDYWLFKLEAHAMDGTFQISGIQNQRHPNLDRYWHLFVAKTTLTF